MPITLQEFWQYMLATPELLAFAGLATGILVLVFGIASLGQTPEEIRRLRGGSLAATARQHSDIVRDDDFALGGLLKTFVPSSRGERTRIARRLRMGGIQRRNGVYLYYVSRAVLGLALPATFVTISMLPEEYKALIPGPLSPAGMSLMTIFQGAVALAVLGFYSPALWLHSKIQNRTERIRLSMPNALDLLQVAVEAGMGFDAAMLRVSRELAAVAPDISEELMMMQLEVQAGKDRQDAFLEMADRTNVSEMRSFANVILQAGQYGTSISTALMTFAETLRLERELKANEKANRLPVQMSGVMALCMMPTLLMICLFPMVIRWNNVFGG